MMTDLRLLKKLLLSDNAGLLLERLEERRCAFERRVRKARKKPSEKSVHDLRVAARRMRSMLALVDVVLSPEDTKKVRGIVEKRLQRLRRVRDVQVEIVRTGKLLASYPQLSGLHKSLGREERRLVASAGRQLRRFDLDRFRRRTAALMHDLIGSLDPDRDEALGRRIEDAVEEAFRKVLALKSEIDPQQPASIHKTRLAFKDFRYMAEVTAPLFAQLTPDRLKAMHDYQTRMGEIQDVESLLEEMREYRRSSGLTSILVVENELRHQRRHLIEQFLKTADEVRFFWARRPLESREVV